MQPRVEPNAVFATVPRPKPPDLSLDADGAVASVGDDDVGGWGVEPCRSDCISWVHE